MPDDMEVVREEMFGPVAAMPPSLNATAGTASGTARSCSTS
ncbi:hypothetical protein [Winogradskya consettensis]|nr:hypothetical protein [Actinoplanes consettensis]